VDNIPLDKPLRAALANSAVTTDVAITPLTELAVQKAGALTAANIKNANKLVSDIFKFDIITTQPVAPTVVAVSAAGQNQKDYTLTLAAVSQLSKTQGVPLADTLAKLAVNISYNGMNSKTVVDFQKAVTDFISSDKNQTGILSTDESASNLAKLNGATTATFKLAVTGPANMAANAIKGLQFEIAIPTGLTIRYNPRSVEISRTNTNPVIITYNPAKGETLSGIVTASPSVTANLLAAKSSAFNSVFDTFNGVNVLTIALYSSTGIGAGDLATVVCDIVPGWIIPTASDFVVRKDSIKAIDGSPSIINGVDITVN
jgi:hypothetical protein